MLLTGSDTIVSETRPVNGLSRIECGASATRGLVQSLPGRSRSVAPTAGFVSSTRTRLRVPPMRCSVTVPMLVPLVRSRRAYVTAFAWRVASCAAFTAVDGGEADAAGDADCARAIPVAAT